MEDQISLKNTLTHRKHIQTWFSFLPVLNPSNKFNNIMGFQIQIWWVDVMNRHMNVVVWCYGYGDVVTNYIEESSITVYQQMKK